MTTLDQVYVETPAITAPVKREQQTFGDFLWAVKQTQTGKQYWNDYLKDVHGAIKAPLAESSGATGGYLIPAQYSSQIYNVAAPISIVRPRAIVLPMSTRTLLLPYLNQFSAPVAGTSALIGNMLLTWGSEGASAETEPTFGMVELNANKLTGYSISAHELDEDSSPTMDVIMTQLFGRAVAWFEDSSCIGGDGIDKPLGVINAPATIGVTRNGATDFKLVDQYAMMAKVHPNSLNSGTLVWLVHNTVIPKLIVSHGLRPDAPLRLGGFPIKVSEQCSVLGTAGDVLLCDFGHYLLGHRSTSVAISTHARFSTDQDVYRLTHRIDGEPWLSGPITLKDGSNTVSPFVKLV